MPEARQAGAAKGDRVRKLRWLAVVTVFALVAAACGRDEEEEATPTTGGGSESPTSAPAAEGLDAGAFGDLGVVCSPAPEGETLTDSDTGVTADTIKVGTVSDPGFTGRPGLNQEMFDTAEAFTAWCNEHGGINGRQLELTLLDAKLTEFQQRMIEACDQGTFMTVGGGAVFDDTGQKERLGCGLPNIAGYLVTGQAIGADLQYQPVPNPLDKIPVGDFVWLGEQFPEATSKIGVLTGNLQTTKLVAERYKEATGAMGWEVVYDNVYNPQGESSWRPFAEGLRDAGVRGVVWVGEPVNLANLMKALADIGYEVDFVRADANHYDALLLSEAGDAADGAFIRSAFYPFADPEQAAENPATQQYLDLVDQYDPGGKIAYLGVQGLSAWMLFATAAKECGADLTRDCVWEQIAGVSDWTGGGLHAPQNVATTEPSDCYVAFEVAGGEFTLPDIGANEGIYSCEEGNVAELKGNYGEGVKCENPAYADDPKPSNCAP